jgi:prepilin peptidase CpaA
MADTISLLLLLILAASLLYAAVRDLQCRRIPNWLTASIALLAVPFWMSLSLPVWPDVAIRIGLAAAVFAVFAALFYAGMMGGGDVKLIAAVALWLTPVAVLHLLVIMAIAGGVLTLAMVAKARLARSGTPEIPYGVAIAIGGMWMIAKPIFNHFA